MSNYFDNQGKWSWNVTADKAEVITDHGDHTHTLDLTNTTIGDLADNTGKVMGDAHRAADHDYKSESEIANTETAVESVAESSANDVGEGIDGGEGMDGGMDF